MGSVSLKLIATAMSLRRRKLVSPRILLCFVLLLSGRGFVAARIVEAWTYREMFEKADLVAIAQAVSTKDTDERSLLLDDIKVIGVTTAFKTALIFKGPKDITAFNLHHFRLESGSVENMVNGPNLVPTARPGPQHRAFLLFLKKEPDGRYAPVTGQTDPAVLSVIELTGAGAIDPSWLDANNP